ncbi:hypothetical protein HMPREF0490_00685 [Lachnospiraceae bacterium 6_1_37FAA]|nr:hypothetical protein HMPREF0490_00685 [Lachnospiraceae bacterium 6_1_37FAA]
MSNTTANEVIQSFESSFADKSVLPESLEMEWLKKAIGRYSIELNDLNFDPELNQFDTRLDRYVIDTLAEFMKQSYQERQYSKVNKRISITGKDLGIDGSNGSKTATKAELDYIAEKANSMVNNQKVTAFV